MDAATRKTQRTADRGKFEEAFPGILNQIAGPPCEEIKDAVQHLREVMM